MPGQIGSNRVKHVKYKYQSQMYRNTNTNHKLVKNSNTNLKCVEIQQQLLESNT